MKVTVEGDCTPAEAREFTGLPDQRPMQTAMAKKLEEQMTVSLDRLSPDAVLELVRVSSENVNSRVIRQFHHGREDQV